MGGMGGIGGAGGCRGPGARVRRARACVRAARADARTRSAPSRGTTRHLSSWKADMQSFPFVLLIETGSSFPNFEWPSAATDGASCECDRIVIAPPSEPLRCQGWWGSLPLVRYGEDWGGEGYIMGGG